jgi:hypothetical protein
LTRDRVVAKLSATFPGSPLRTFFVTCLTMLLLGSSARAQEPADAAEPDEPAPPRVAIAPLSYHPQDIGDADSAAIVAALHDGLARPFRATERADVADADELRALAANAPLYDKTVQLGESWATMGIDAYKGLDLDGAVRSLRESVDSFREVDHDLVAPRRFAELLMFLSVSHLERRSQMVEPLDRMQEMILYDPGRVLERGFYPERVVQFYESARVALERDLRRAPDLGLSERLVDRLGADYVASAYIFERDGGFEMVGYLWNAETGQSLPAERVRLATLDPERVADAAGRLGSRLLACIVPPDVVVQELPESQGESPLAVQVNFAYAAFFTLPGPEQITSFPNIGASFGLEWSFTREFSVVGMMQVLTSTSELSGYLLEDFTTLRGFAGIDLGWDFWVFSAGMSTSLELTRVGDITLCNSDLPPLAEDPSCRDFRESFASPLYVGVNARPRLSYHLLQSVELQATVSFSYFFVPLNDRELNLPFTAESGLVYRF